MEKSKFTDWLSGGGTLLTGVAAIWAVYSAREPVINYLTQKQTQTQTQIQAVVLNTCEAKEEAEKMIKTDNPNSVDELLKDIPSEIPKDKTEPVGLVISEEFRPALKSQLLQPGLDDKTKKKFIEEYWNKSIRKEVKGEVDLKLNGP